MEYISQKILVDWCHLDEVGAAWVPATYKQYKYQVLINAGQTLSGFTKAKKLCWPERVKKIGTSHTIDDKKGFTVMVGMTFRTQQLLPPFIIFSNGFYKKLMNIYFFLNNHNTIVKFSNKYCQTEENIMSW